MSGAALDKAMHYASIAEECLDNEKFLRNIRLAEFFLWLDERLESTERTDILHNLLGGAKR